MARVTDSYVVTIKLDTNDTGQVQNLIKQLERIAPAATKSGKAVRQSMKQTQIEARRFGRGLQNASYQVQDFIVQVSGGVEPMRSLSQQLPQLLINMGALGAVIGVVAAGLPLMIQAFSDGSEEARTLNAAMEALEQSFADVDSSLRQFQKSGEEFDRLLVNLNAQASESAFLEFLRKLDDELEPGKFSILIKQFQTLYNTLAQDASTGFFSDIVKAIDFASNAISGKLEGMTKTTEANLLRINNAMKQFNVGEIDAQRIILALDLIESGAFDTEQAMAELQYLVESFDTSAGSGKGLIDLQQTFVKANESANVLGQSIVRLGKTIELTGVTAQKAYQKIDPTVFTNKYNDALRESAIADGEIIRRFQESAEALNNTDNFTNIAKEFSLAEEAVQIFGQTFDTAFNGVAMGTQTVSSAVENMVKVIIAQLGRLAALKGIEALFPSLRGQLVRSTSAQGNIFQNGEVTPFAKGGVVSGPTVFPMAKGGVGLMGEAGSPEAIMPLTRTASGNLGVEATGMNVTVNNMAPNTQIKTTRDDNGLSIDVLLDTVAGAIQRGGNNVADALESTYPLNRGRQIY